MVPSRFLYLVRHGEAGNDGALTQAGRQQASAAGERLRYIRFSAIRHSPEQRGEETADLIADFLPGVPVGPSGLLGDYLPPVPGQPELPPPYAGLFDGYSAEERSEGAELATAAIERYGRPAGQDSSELLVTHNFLIGWFVRHALDAPDWRWLGLNQCNGGLTVILYRTGVPASLISFNDIGHLPPSLRWTGFPAEMVPPPRLPRPGRPRCQLRCWSAGALVSWGHWSAAEPVLADRVCPIRMRPGRAGERLLAGPGQPHRARRTPADQPALIQQPGEQRQPPSPVGYDEVQRVLAAAPESARKNGRP